ncbi:MAG: hypothetical protein ABIV39_13600, partial [Verrucomicrobiota bacterium]
NSSQLILTKEQSDVLLKNLKQVAGIKILAGPRVTTTSGNQAEVSVTDEKTIDNHLHRLGPTVNVLPQINPDGRSIKLTVGASITRETARK